MTPVFCCGFECGVPVGGATGAHWDAGAGATFSTTTVRTGDRSLQTNPAGITDYASQTCGASTSYHQIIRVYLRFASLPNANAVLLSLGGNPWPGLYFKQSDGKVYCGYYSGGVQFAASGVTVTTGQWYRVDFYLNSSANPWVWDAKIDGTSLGQASYASAATVAYCYLSLGQISSNTTATYDAYWDDVLASQTAVDYPIGDGYVNHFVPTSDGPHNVASANDFERGTTGTDITNATTDAYTLVDEVPLANGTPTDDSIGAIAPPNTSDYVRVNFGPAPGISTPTTAPRMVNVIMAYHQSGTGTGSIGCAIHDSDGSVGDAGFSGSGSTTIRHGTTWGRLGGVGLPWTVDKFNSLHARIWTNDANPDQFADSLLVEAEFAPTTSIKTWHGLANSSTKTAMGLARASVKTGQGLA